MHTCVCVCVCAGMCVWGGRRDRQRDPGGAASIEHRTVVPEESPRPPGGSLYESRALQEQSLGTRRRLQRSRGPHRHVDANRCVISVLSLSLKATCAEPCIISEKRRLLVGREIREHTEREMRTRSPV